MQVPTCTFEEVPQSTPLGVQDAKPKGKKCKKRMIAEVDADEEEEEAKEEEEGGDEKGGDESGEEGGIEGGDEGGDDGIVQVRAALASLISKNHGSDAKRLRV